MAVLEIDNMTHGFGERLLYRDVSFRLNEQEHLGITGQNGTGKSTFMNILSGKQLVDEGTIAWKKTAKVGYLDQHAELPDNITIEQYLQQSFAHLYDIEAKLIKCYQDYSVDSDETLLEKAGRFQEQLDANDFYTIDTKIANVTNGLGIDVIGIGKLLSELSGGQKAKVILAKLFLEENDVYLLDEPTNFLDVAHIEWLVGYLQSFEGSYIVVSHDFDFLERITTSICDVDNEKITKYKGTFKQAMRQKEERRALYEKEYAAQQEKIKKEEAYIRKYKAGSRSTMAKSRQKQLDRMEVMAKPTSQTSAHFAFPYHRYAGARILKVDNLSVGYEHPLLSHISFSILNGEKVVITGKNGIGKSTLLKTILGERPQLTGEITPAAQIKMNYFEQLLHFQHAEITPIQYLKEQYSTLEDKVVRGRLAAVGLEAQKAMRPISQLSGGEQCKIKLCELTMKDSTLLILDEPTNHLDEKSKVALKQALQDFPGSMILVSHEPHFYEGWVDRIINVEENTESVID